MAVGFLAVCGAVTGASAQRAPAATKPLPVADQELLREVARRGELLYAYDQAAWHGTDDMMAKLSDPASRVGGWIVDGPAAAPQLVFFDKDDSTPHALYVADFRGGKLVSSKVLSSTDDRELSPARKALIGAREAAVAAVAGSQLKRCSSGPMNTVVLPPAEPGAATLVYLLTPQAEMNVIPFGGHFLVPVGSDGKAGAVRRFTNSCLAMPTSEKGKPPPVALGVTHLLDALPTEIHVFLSLVAHMPIMVGTKDGRAWWVDGTTINLLEDEAR
jgi:hypothetical protein